MRKTLKRSLSFLLAITIIFGSVCVGLSEIGFEGLFAVRAKAASCGETGDCFWLLDGTVLTIRGNGAMEDYKYTNDYENNPHPWGTSITKVIIENGVTSIGSDAFYNCTSLTSITIPDSVTSIGEDAFFCTGYYDDSSNWENDVLYIGKHLIKANSTLSGKYSIKTGTKTIADGAFYYCRSLTNITIPDSVTSIGSYAFEGCKSLTSITIPDSVTSIGSYAFCDCTSLTYITISDSVTSIGNFAFSNTGYYNNSFRWENKVLYIGNHLVEAKNSVSGGYIIKENTKTIASSAFYYCTSLTSITIPDSVTIIGNSAFGYCKGLTSITIPDSVTSIGDYVFYGCTNLTSSILSDNLISIGNYAFYDCSNLTSISIPDSVTSIGNDAFRYCKSLTSVTIPDSVTSIGNHAFDYCTSLTSITIPDSVTSIGSFAFSCTSLTSVTIPDSVTSIGDYAFYYCSSLTSVYITDIVAWCGIDFENSYSNPLQNSAKLYLNGELVKTLVIPDSVTSIGNYAFGYCESLTSVTIPDSVTSIGDYAFGYCKGLTSVSIGNSVTSIGDSAFENCTSLTSITIPDSVTSIGDHAFVFCESLTSVTIPDSVTSIGCGVFYCCTNLDEIITPCNSYACSSFSDYELVLTHNSLSDWIIDKNATCGKNGSKHKVCTECDEVVEKVTIPATGKHTASDWIIDKQATVTAAGTKYKKCTVCGTKLETATIPQLKPATPKVTSTNAIGGVQLSWNKISGATKYVVYRRNAGQTSFAQIGTTTSTTFLDKNVKSGQYYCYTVRAYNSAGGYSAYVYANTSTRKYMETPKLTTIYNHQNGLAIKWNAVAGVTNGYRVYRRGAGQTTWTYLGTVKTTYFTDTSVKYRSGEYFRYTVIADGGYHSKFDTTGLYLKRLENPTLKSATSSSSGITVKWETVVGTTGYYVYRKTANSGWSRIATVSGTNNTSYLDKTAKKGTTYTYTVRAVYGSTLSAYYSGISCKDKY